MIIGLDTFYSALAHFFLRFNIENSNIYKHQDLVNKKESKRFVSEFWPYLLVLNAQS